MADSLFNVFGDLNRTVSRNVLRQPLSNENMGKTMTPNNVPMKPNEPMKKAVKPGEPKKSFLSNVGKVLQGTPARQVFSPKIVKASPMIYTEESDEGIDINEFWFTKPAPKPDTYYDLFEREYERGKEISPATPPPKIGQHTMELAFDDYLDFSNCSLNSQGILCSSLDSVLDEDLGLPDIY